MCDLGSVVVVFAGFVVSLSHSGAVVLLGVTGILRIFSAWLYICDARRSLLYLSTNWLMRTRTVLVLLGYLHEMVLGPKELCR